MTLRSRATSSGMSDCGEHVALEVDAGRDLGDDEAVRRQPHHTALGDVGDVLALRDGAPAREGDVLDLLDELLDLALLVDAQLPSASDILAPALKKPEKTIFFARAVMSTNPPAPAVTCGLAESFDTLTEPWRSICRKDSSEQSKPPAWK